MGDERQTPGCGVAKVQRSKLLRFEGGVLELQGADDESEELAGFYLGLRGDGPLAEEAAGEW